MKAQTRPVYSTGASAEAEKVALEVQVLAHIIREKMHHLYGDSYRVDIDHDLGLVLIVSKGRS